MKLEVLNGNDLCTVMLKTIRLRYNSIANIQLHKSSCTSVLQNNTAVNC